MPKSLIVVTLVVLLGILGVMSFTLRKQTDPPAPPSKEEIEKKQNDAAQIAKARKQIEINMQDAKLKGQHGKVIAADETEKTSPVKQMPPALPPKAQNMPAKGAAAISNKWFETSEPGQPGIDKAQKAKEEQDKQQAAVARAAGIPAPAK